VEDQDDREERNVSADRTTGPRRTRVDPSPRAIRLATGRLHARTTIAAKRAYAVINGGRTARSTFAQLRRKKDHPRMNTCQPSHSQSPNKTKRPSAIVMKDRKKSESVGHSGPWTSPMPCQTRSAATIQSHPATAIARIPVTSVTSGECLVLSIRRGQDEGTQPHGVCDG
jgi:hypothetical protein